MSKRGISALAFAASFAYAPLAPALAYEPIAVVDGAGITGRVILEGASPASTRQVSGPDAAACGAGAPPSEVGPEGGLRHALVYLAKVDRGLAIDATRVVTVGLRACNFEPVATLGQVGQVLEIRNLDPLPHTLRAHANGDDNALFELALPLQNQLIRKKLKDPGLLRLECADGHSWASGEVMVLSHPYGARTDSDGRFTIAGIPPGTYTVVARHARLGEVRQSITLAAREVAKLDLTLRAP